VRPSRSDTLDIPGWRRFLHGLGLVFIILAYLGCGLLCFTGLGLAAALWALSRIDRLQSLPPPFARQ
jgi:hypothetical protein